MSTDAFSLVNDPIKIKDIRFEWKRLIHDFAGFSVYPAFYVDLFESAGGLKVLDLNGNGEYYLAYNNDFDKKDGIPHYGVGNKVVGRLLNYFKDNKLSFAIDLIRDYTIKFNELSGGSGMIK